MDLRNDLGEEAMEREIGKGRSGKQMKGKGEGRKVSSGERRGEKQR